MSKERSTVSLAIHALPEKVYEGEPFSWAEVHVHYRPVGAGGGVDEEPPDNTVVIPPSGGGGGASATLVSAEGATGSGQPASVTSTESQPPTAAPAAAGAPAARPLAHQPVRSGARYPAVRVYVDAIPCGPKGLDVCWPDVLVHARPTRG